MPISQNFPQFIVIHTVKGFDIVNKAEIDVFLELSCFFDDTYSNPFLDLFWIQSMKIVVGPALRAGRILCN